jgi:hypothetical protein
MRLHSYPAALAILAPVTTLAASINYGNQAIGGFQRRSLTPATGLPGTWQYYGCYSDSTSQRTLGLASYTDSAAMTDESCVNFCSAKGYTFAGTGQ